MAEEKVKRKLTAILSADVKGYSRLMGDDEEATVRTITAYREVMIGHITEHRGRVVDAKGDNVLADFPSVVDAVRSAVQVQRELAKRNAELPEHRRMEFRIGINLGDVIEEGGTIYGDGVNVAARLESLAPPGGICISGPVHDQVENKAGVEYEYLGEQQVKNIAKPVRVYQLRMEPRGNVSEIRRKVELPEKPSIAVLPFANMSEDKSQEFFADGLAEEIITALSKTPKLFVIARNSTFVYKGKPVNVQQVSRELGVNYVLEGSVRRSGEQLRITAQLIDATTGNHLWAERYDRELKEVFAIQDDVTMKILTSLQVKLTAGEEARMWARGTKNLDAYLKLLAATEDMFQFNKEHNALAQQLAREAVDLDPQYASAYMILAKTHMMDIFLGTSSSPKQSMAQAFQMTQKAIAIDESLGAARGVLGFIYTMSGQFEKGIEEAEKALSLEPNSDIVLHYMGLALRWGGRPNEAIPVIKKAIRLNPFAPSNYLYNLGLSYLFAGQNEEAIAECRKATVAEPHNLGAQLALTVAYGLSGRDEEARATASEVLRMDPKFSLEGFLKTLVYKNQADKDRFVDALRNAGLK